MSDNINILIHDKIKKYPEGIQGIIMKALELAAFNQPTAIAEQLEGVVRDLTKNKENL
jgi:hypothetical protein